MLFLTSKLQKFIEQQHHSKGTSSTGEVIKEVWIVAVTARVSPFRFPRAC